MEMDLLSEREIATEMRKRSPLLRSLRGDSGYPISCPILSTCHLKLKVSSTTLCEVQNELYLSLLPILMYTKTY